MAEPNTTVRWHAPAARGAVPRLLTALLGLAALTGCAWAVLAGRAWLDLLSGCSRWLVHSQQPADVAEANSQLQQQAPKPVTRAAVPATPPPPAELPTSKPVATASSSSPRHAWPEPLQYGGATCAGVFVYAVTLSERAPRWSAVSLATTSGARGKYARPGQRVGDWQVLGITDDWTGANPVVWLAREEHVCRASLTGNPSRVEAVQAEARQREAQLREEARRRRAERRRRWRARRRR